LSTIKSIEYWLSIDYLCIYWLLSIDSRRFCARGSLWLTRPFPLITVCISTFNS
jgi:hypothetical protein